MEDLSFPFQRPLTRFLEKIIALQSFERVSDFLYEENWDCFLSEERQLIAQFLLLAADRAILKDSSIALTPFQIYCCFKQACAATPKSARVWFRFGSYLSMQNSEASLHEAIDYLEKSIAIDNCFFDSHYALASALFQYGLLRNESGYFFRSADSFAAGFRLIEEPTSCPASFLWYWGNALFLTARSSGEPYDYIEAADRYRRAIELGFVEVELYKNYAICATYIAFLTGKIGVIRESVISLHEKALVLLLERENGQYSKEIMLQNCHIGCCYFALFENFYEKNDFLQADLAFQRALEHDRELPAQFWQKWGELNFYAATLYEDEAYMRKAVSCFEACEESKKTLSLDLNNFETLYAFWAKSLLLLGKKTKEEYLFFEAHEKAKKAFSIGSKKSDRKAHHKSRGIAHPESYAALGLSLAALGEYFQDHSYYENGIKLLQDGIAIHTKNGSIWQAFGIAKFGLFQLNETESLLEEAVISYAIASKSIYAYFPSFWVAWGKILLSFASYADDAVLVKESIHRFEKALELSERVDSEVLFCIATAYSLLGEIEEEEEFFERALFLFTELSARSVLDLDMLHQYAVAQLYYAEIVEEMDEFYKAKQLYEEYLAQDMENEEALIEYALCLMHIGYKKSEGAFSPEEWFLAESFFLRALQMGNSSSYYHLASLYALMGNRAESIERLYNALEVGMLPPPEEILDDLWFSEEMQKTAQFHSFFSLYVEMNVLAVDSSLKDLLQEEGNSEE